MTYRYNLVLDILSEQYCNGSDVAWICNGGPGVSTGQTAPVASLAPPGCHQAPGANISWEKYS